MSINLRQTDLAMFSQLGIPPQLLAEAHVRRVTSREAREDFGIQFKADALDGVMFPYLDPVTDKRVTCRLRRDHPELDRDGRPLNKYLTPFGDVRRLFFPPGSVQLLADASITVVLLEAEKSVLAITAAAVRANRRLLAIGLGGCWGWKGTIGKTTDAAGARVDEKGALPDFDRIEWRNRDVVILFDANAATNPRVQVARRALASELIGRGARVRIADVPVESGINGPDDYVGKHGDPALFALIDSACSQRWRTESNDEGREKKKESQATAIVKLATAHGAELFHTPSGDGYISIYPNGHREHHRLNHRSARNYLTRLFYLDSGTAPNATGLQDAIATLNGMATFDGAQHDVHVRVAGDDDRVYLDLGDPAWRAVEITSAGWRVVGDPVFRFRRPRGFLALPMPVTGGSIDDLRPFVNVTSNDFSLVVAWQTAALRPRGPYVLLDLLGEQGTAKSTTARIVRRTIDPHESELRRPPRNTEDVMIAAANSYVVTVDNVSFLPDWLSDDLAMLATGGGLSKRELYSDAEECILRAQRPIIINGIGHVVTRADLLDRAIVLTLPVIPDAHRQLDADFWAAFTEAHPRILGALLDTVVMALRNRTTTRVPCLPRMADFTLWNVAAEPACPWKPGTFLSAYLNNRQGAIETGLDGDPIVEVVRALAPWEGTASDLLDELTHRTNEQITRRKDWFSKPRQVSDTLRRLAPGLRRIGYEVTFARAPHTGRRMIRLEKITHDASPSSPEAETGISQGDASGDGYSDPSVMSSPPSSPEACNKTGLRNAGDAGDVAKCLFSKAEERKDGTIDTEVLDL